jgi:CRP/FNR family transcriptional regulator
MGDIAAESEKRINIFLNQFRLVEYKKGEIILSQDELPKTGYVIKTGIIKTYNITAEGDEKPISFDRDGEVFPTSWVFGKTRRSLFFYEAFTDCQIYHVPADEYRAFLKSNPALLYRIFDRLVGFYTALQFRVNALEQSRASSKVLSTIRFLCLRFGEDLAPNIVRIELVLSQQELANFMGLTRETTSIELKKLRAKKVLRRSKQHYIVQTKKLNDLLDEEYDPGVNLS